MQSKKLKRLYLISLVLLSFILLISNIGQNFKNDIFLNDRTIEHINNFIDIWNNSKNQSQYYESSAKYITDYMTQIGLTPGYNDSYSKDLNIYVPNFKYPSVIEVIDVYGKTIKKYNYGNDYFEFFKENIHSGIVKSHVSVLEKIPNKNILLNQIILSDDYYNKSGSEIQKIDSYLKYNGAEAVITPAHSYDIKLESGLYDGINNSMENPLLKFIVTKRVYSELKDYSKNGYTLKLQSGADVIKSNCKILCGKIEGKNPYYKPLIISTYYDGIFKTPDSKQKNFNIYPISTSIMLECMKVIDVQRNNRPDRTIVFIFLPGQMVSNSIKMNTADTQGDYLLFNLLGTGNELILNSTSNNKTLSQTIENLIKTNDLTLNSKNTDSIIKSNMVKIDTISSMNDYEINNECIYKSGKFILSIISDECYDLDFLTIKLWNIRNVKRYIKSHSAIISIIAFIFMLLSIFGSDTSKNN